jgi:SAM-dependent methyltransferase
MGVKLEARTANLHDAALPQCPVCGSEAQHVRTLTPEMTSRALDRYFGGKFNFASCPDIETYRILSCRKCTLDFADPPRPGSSQFYEELGRQPNYYASNRWEWGISIAELKRNSVASLIEVGCATGAFLKMAADALGCRTTGIDINADAVATCRTAGLEAYCETIEEHLRRFTKPTYDCAVAFHCLEHVANPLAFASSLFSLVRPGGFMLLSTPLSPMSFERRWHDPLNHPPHHLTRWNERSYAELARSLQAGLRVFSPPAADPLRRAARAVALDTYGTPRAFGTLQVRSAPLLHPIHFAQEFIYQLHRPHLNSRPAGDVILGVFQKH